MKWIKKGAGILIAVLALSFATFLAFQVLPGDPAMVRLGTNATPEALEALREEMGLNDGLLVRYGRWIGGAIRGDFGESMKYRRPVSALLWQVLPNTLLLAGLSILMILVIAFPLGLLYARFPGSPVDRAGAVVNQTAMAVPAFFLGLLISVVLGLWLRVFTPGAFVSYDRGLGACLSYLVFPAMAIAIPKAAMTVRFLRSSLLTERSKDYVRTARSKGLTENKVLMLHMLPNALPGVRTFIGVIVSEIIAGSIVVEQVFGVDGLGLLLVQSISNRDYNVVQAIVLYIGIVVLVVNSLMESE
ncbi:MAG: ABC transporter permease [Lachnospiraceae bacterium]|nr:ABC transporter permease [Lachnospiraceae bacterium]